MTKRICIRADHYPLHLDDGEWEPRLHHASPETPCEYAPLQRVLVGDCVEVMRGMEPDSIDAIVTDPPYGLEFMGKEWDKLGAVVEHPDDGEGPWGRVNRVRFGASAESMQGWHSAWATEALRVLKPGGHLLAFGGTRTYHRLVCGIEDAGFEIRDCLAWLYGSGFPKSLDVSKAIDKAAGVERGSDYVPNGLNTTHGKGWGGGRTTENDPPATDLARQWDGWGTALKPAYEPIVLARKPLRGTVAANVAEYGTGALNIDDCRIGTEKRTNEAGALGAHGIYGAMERNESRTVAIGRWPANVVLDEEAAAMLDAQSGERGGGFGWRGSESSPSSISLGGIERPSYGQEIGYGDTGGASRFFYTAKASRSEREAWGRLDLPEVRRTDGREKDIENPRLRTTTRVNHHPTVKPVALMEWLIRLVLPDGGIVLDPFLGSGTTLVAARLLNVNAIGIERDEEYAEIARQRIAAQWEVRLI